MKARRKLRLLALAITAVAVLGLQGGSPVQAHGAGVVKSCLPGTDCTTNSANNAVFAICSPLNAATTCNPGRDVRIQVSNFGLGATVHLWWLNGEVDNPNATDCSQLVGLLGRTALGDVSTSSITGKGSLDVHLPPAGGTVSSWSYGSNWICGTTAAAGGTGTIGDQLFAVYPV